MLLIVASLASKNRDEKLATVFTSGYDVRETQSAQLLEKCSGQCLNSDCGTACIGEDGQEVLCAILKCLKKSFCRKWGEKDVFSSLGFQRTFHAGHPKSLG